MRRLARCSAQTNSVARPVAYPEELAGTADAGDHEEGLAATAEPGGDTAPSDDDSDDGFYWTGSSENWASIFSAALALANPVPTCDETSKPTVATFFSGTAGPTFGPRNVG